MKIKAQKDYEPCPEYQGVAVVVDATEPEMRDTDWGLRETFRLVFEIPLEMEDGKRYIVRSAPMSPSIHPKATFRKFLKQMLGRDLSVAEQKEFETEDIIGMNVSISIVHEESEDGRVFDQIALCRPWKGEPMEAAGDYVRVKDRKEKGKGRKRGDDDGGDDDDSSHRGSKESTFRRAEQGPKGKGPTDQGLIKVHVGKNKGLELRDLTRDAIEKLIDGWLAAVYPKMEKPLADDRRLAAALEEYRKKFAAGEDEEPEDPDDVPY